MRHTWKETWSGLRRNLTMTIAVIVTMWVSLSLFGTGVLATQEVDLLKGKWYDKVEVTVYLCTQESQAATCDPGQNVTEGQRTAIHQALTDNPMVAEVFYESKEDAYRSFQDYYRNNPLKDSLTVDQMNEAFRVKLKDPTKFEVVRDAVAGMKGVYQVQDLKELLEPVFQAMNLAKWATIGASALLLLAAALQIANTIRMSAFSRRREIGIMRLVGASNWYIMLPFLLESLIAALVGVALAGGTLCLIVYLLVFRNPQLSIPDLGVIGWRETGVAVAWVAAIGIVLSIIPTLIATRKYLRV